MEKILKKAGAKRVSDKAKIALKSIIEDLNQKKFELNKDQFLDYFSPFAIRLMSL